jgi:hypothetical protein
VTSHFDTDGGEAVAIGILPTTRWDQIQPERPYLDGLTSNTKIRHERLFCVRST